jgi:vitamin B12 transporter
LVFSGRDSSSSRPSSVTRRKPRRLLRRVKQRRSQWSCQRRASIFRSINRPQRVTVISSEDIEQKQIQRVSDALREVPGLAVVQTGTAGQLTSVFMRGLPSQDMQVLLDGIPINQGLSGAMNFADITTDDIDRIEVVRGPQSALYGPHALAGVIQIFTKQGTGTPGVMVAGEGGSYDSFREWGQSDGKIGDFDYSVAGSRLDTDNARPNNNYRNTAGIANVGWSPDQQLRIGSLFTYSFSDTGNPNTIFDPRPIDHFLPSVG